MAHGVYTVIMMLCMHTRGGVLKLQDLQVSKLHVTRTYEIKTLCNRYNTQHQKHYERLSG